jgi:hypothetical protein
MSHYGPDTRLSESYWALSGPSVCTAPHTCRACRGPIYRGETVMCRDGRKLRFFYHATCFSGTEDPRTQANSSFVVRKEYHEKSAPALSSLEGPRAYKDSDGRVLGREVFKPSAPSHLGKGKWSTCDRGYKGPAAKMESSGKDSLTEFITSSHQHSVGKTQRASDPGKQSKTM